MDTLEAIRLRKSTRSFQSISIKSEKIEQLIEAARSAPKAGTLHISVIENPDILKEINQATLLGMKNSGDEFLRERADLDGYQPLYDAPLLILLSSPQNSPYGNASASCAAASVAIAATALELGSCYVISLLLGLEGNEELCNKVGIPLGFSPICGVLAGYPAAEIFPTSKTTEYSVSYCR